MDSNTGCGGHKISDAALNDSDSKSASITSRLDRLETEINLLLMLSTKQTVKRDRSESPKHTEKHKPDKNTTKKIHIFNTEHAGPSTSCQTPQELSVYFVNQRETPVPSTKEKKRKDKENADQDVKKNKRPRKKRSVCRCRCKKRFSTEVEKPITPPSPKCICCRGRSKSVGFCPRLSSKAKLDTDESSVKVQSKNSIPLKPKILSRSCPTSNDQLEPRINELCHLVSDLQKNKDTAMSISDEWKQKFISMQKNCDTMKIQQNQTIAQKKFLSICYQSEMQHRKTLEKFINTPESNCHKCRSDKDNIKNFDCEERLAEEKSKHEELLSVCKDLRQEFVESQVRFNMVKQSDGEEKNLKSTEEFVKSQMSIENQEYKKQIKEHLTEIEELRLTCAKNAEWACEESTLKAKLMEENRFLLDKINQSNEKEQKQRDQLSIMRKALLKIGKDNPKVKKFVHALRKFDVDGCEETDDTSVGINRIDTDVSYESCSNSSEAECLIKELKAVIRIQRKRIQELVDVTSGLVSDTEIICNAKPIDDQQTNELEMARKQVVDVKARYEALATCARHLRKSMKQNMNLLAAECEIKVSLQSDVKNLTKLWDECQIDIQDKKETIEALQKNLTLKNEVISSLKDEKNALNKKVKALEKQRELLKATNDKMHIDVVRQESIINNLQKHVGMQQHEQVLQKLAIDKEKEQAIRAAQFATDKLMQTVEDFRRHRESHTKVRHVLTKLLHEKDEQLKAAIDKVSAMTLDPQRVVDVMKKTCQVDSLVEKYPDDGYSTTNDFHYSSCEQMAEALQRARLSSERLVDMHVNFAEVYHNNSSSKSVDDADFENFMDTQCVSCIEDVTEYDTPQLFTVQEENEDEDEDEFDSQIC